jgi:hypothetical protein
MKSDTQGRIVCTWIFLTLLFAMPAAAHQQEPPPYTMEVLVDGVPLPEYFARDTTYVEALEGREYSIRLRNRTSGRVAIALSVDGLNSIDAKTTSAGSAAKWILGPYETITLDGWQTSNSTARRFFFTTETDSYGAWLGKTSNLGIISAAVFREKRYRPAPVTRQELRFDGDASGMPAAPAEGEAAGESNRPLKSAAEPGRALALSDDLAATGIGRQVGHPVRRVKFKAEATPAAVLNIRYEYHDALVQLGVLPADYREPPLHRRERARGFEDTGFAPDPYGPRP